MSFNILLYWRSFYKFSTPLKHRASRGHQQRRWLGFDRTQAHVKIGWGKTRRPHVQTDDQKNGLLNVAVNLYNNVEPTQAFFTDVARNQRHAHYPIVVAVVVRREQLSGTSKAQRFAWRGIQLPRNRVQLFLQKATQVAALGQILPWGPADGFALAALRPTMRWLGSWKGRTCAGYSTMTRSSCDEDWS